MRYFMISVTFLLLLSLGCTIDNQSLLKAKQVAVNKVSNELYGSPTDTDSIVEKAKIIKEDQSAFTIKVCDSNIECTCEENYFIVNVAKVDYGAEIIDSKHCLFG